MKLEFQFGMEVMKLYLVDYAIKSGQNYIINQQIKC